MDAFTALVSAWGLCTLALVLLLVYRSLLTRKESDWIPLTDDAREERAIHTQEVTEKKAQKLIWPIRALGTISVVLLLVTLGYWVYQGVSNPKPTP